MRFDGQSDRNLHPRVKCQPPQQYPLKANLKQCAQFLKLLFQRVTGVLRCCQLLLELKKIRECDQATQNKCDDILPIDSIDFTKINYPNAPWCHAPRSHCGCARGCRADETVQRPEAPLMTGLTMERANHFKMCAGKVIQKR